MKNILVPAFAIAVFAFLLFGTAGRLDWIQGWATIAIVLLVMGPDSARTAKGDPELMKYRARPGPGTVRIDYVFLSIFSVGMIVLFVIGALDSGRYAPRDLDWIWLIAGGVLFTAGQLLVGASMRANTYFEKTVRLQSERGHKVIDSGPYATVRHPGYTGFIFGYALGFPLMMHSAWALIPAAITAAAVVWRTVFEDRFLQDNLAGYAA